jgi:hypothetical protein
MEKMKQNNKKFIRNIFIITFLIIISFILLSPLFYNMKVNNCNSILNSDYEVATNSVVDCYKFNNYPILTFLSNYFLHFLLYLLLFPLLYIFKLVSKFQIHNPSILEKEIGKKNTSILIKISIIIISLLIIISICLSPYFFDMKVNNCNSILNSEYEISTFGVTDCYEFNNYPIWNFAQDYILYSILYILIVELFIMFIFTFRLFYFIEEYDLRKKKPLKNKKL